LDNLAVYVDEDEALVICRLRLLGGLELLLSTLFGVAILVLEICYRALNLVVALFECDLHHVDDLVASEGRSVLTLQHLLRAKLTLVDASDFLHRDDNCRLLREALERNVILVDKETELVKDEVSLD
jgi:hypothetical protein